MSNPYKALPEQNFWKKGVFETQELIAPIMSKKFTISPNDNLVTAGSCFAQNVAKHLKGNSDVSFYTAEEIREGDPVFSGRYGNIYTAQQLLQLFDECESGNVDENCAIRRLDGRYVDVNRPYMYANGFETPQDVLNARREHIVAVRKVFRQADIFVFTLGLTEAWRSPNLERVFPICPGIYSDDTSLEYEFKNYSFTETESAMNEFIHRISEINPNVKVILTVSPVPLTATYTKDHVLVATMHSKSVLRVVCSEMVSKHENAFYFPSYEMIANAYTIDSAYSQENLREIKTDAIKDVMRFFDSEYMGKEVSIAQKTVSKSGDAPDDDVLCDDVEIEKSMGF
jgi:hypothetical protein